MLEVNKIHIVDAKKGFEKLNNNSLDLIVTSPPYWQKRDYGVKNQLGLESDYNLFIDNLIDVFDAAYPKLKDTGSLWVNIWDTYAGSNNAFGDKNDYLNKKNQRSGKVPNTNIKKTSMIGVPMRFAIKMIDNAWILRNIIIWQKPNANPGGGADKRKFTNDYEFFFWFVKTNKYYFNQLQEPLANTTYLRAKSKNYSVKGATGIYKGFTPQNTNKYYEKILNGEITGRNMRTVWNISTKKYNGEHFAVFPPELVKRPILSTTKKGDLVCDPFIGSGTTAEIAKKYGRNFIGFDLNPSSIKMTNERTLKGISYERRRIAKVQAKAKLKLMNL